MYFDSSLKLSGEYEALLHGLRLAVLLGIKRLLVYGDSLLVVQQVNKEWDINKDTMDAYIMEIRTLENKFSGLEIHHVIRGNNMDADVLSKLGSDQANVSRVASPFHQDTRLRFHRSGSKGT
jgi:ribonuclease HI